MRGKPWALVGRLVAQREERQMWTEQERPRVGGIVLTPEYGPRNRFGAILTTAEIEPDPLYSGEKLCHQIGRAHV